MEDEYKGFKITSETKCHGHGTFLHYVYFTMYPIVITLDTQYTWNYDNEDNQKKKIKKFIDLIVKEE